MNFFQIQDKARSRTLKLGILFVAGLLATAFLIHCVIIFFISASSDELNNFFFLLRSRIDLLIIDLVVISTFIIVIAIWKTDSMNATGPDGVALALGGTLVKRGLNNPCLRRLYNVVEEVALAAGVPIPQIYILKNESGINACAIGSSPDNSAICVTQGAMDYLSRDELQGVVAHEISHIVNNDVAINSKIIGYLFALEIIAVIATSIFRLSFGVIRNVNVSSSRRRNGSSVLAFLTLVCLVCLLLLVIGYVGCFFGNLMRAAISRQREYLADASAVQFTRNPRGIAGALKKIGCHNLGSSVANTASLQISHMFFGSVFNYRFMQFLFMTHPPLVKRIQAIEPDFDGVFPHYVVKVDWACVREDRDPQAEAIPGINIFGVNGQKNTLIRGKRINPDIKNTSVAGLQTPINQTIPMSRNECENSQAFSFGGTKKHVVNLSDADEHLGFSRLQILGDDFFDSVFPGNNSFSTTCKLDIVPAVLEECPVEFDEFLVDANSARATFYTILLSEVSEKRHTQLCFIQSVEPTLKQLFERAQILLVGLGKNTKLIVARKTTPLLRTMKIDEYDCFRSNVLRLCATDGITDLFEYTLQASTIRQLDLFFHRSRKPKIFYTTHKATKQNFRIVLSYLAYAGAFKKGDAELAFEIATDSVKLDVKMIPFEQISLATFTSALNQLALVAPMVKRDMLRAFYKCIVADGVVVEQEAAILCAITAALGVPAPVWKNWGVCSC